jgi:hypothetical protein
VIGVIPVPDVIEDPLLPHQVRIKGSLETGLLSATCSCLIRPDGSYTPLAEGVHLGPRAILAAQRRHEAEVTG